MSDHDRALDILASIAQLLADAPGTLREHQLRLNSIQFLKERLVKLHEIEEAIPVGKE
jgi:hypothetical protein